MTAGKDAPGGQECRAAGSVLSYEIFLKETRSAT